MGAYDDAAAEGAMIAFLPTSSDWCKIDLPHMTLVYAGKVADLGPADFNTMAKDASSLSMLIRPFSLQVRSIDTFDEGINAVKVLKFRSTPELEAARSFVEHWNQSEHPFNPHATIGPANLDIPYPPSAVGFDRLVVQFGDDSITFGLNGKY